MDQEIRDRQWGTYNQWLAQCISIGDYAAYCAVQYKMSLQLIYEKRYLDAFRMLSGAFLYDLNGVETPCVSEDVVRIAQNLYQRISDLRPELDGILLNFSESSYTLYHFYPVDDVVRMFLLFSAGEKEQANEIFHKYLPDAQKWRQKVNVLLNKRLTEQDRQLIEIQAAETKYKESGELDEYIAYWETIWANGGLLFYSSKWWFVLPDLYFKRKNFDDVINFCEMVKILDIYAANKADKYIQRAQERKAKAKKQ